MRESLGWEIKTAIKKNQKLYRFLVKLISFITTFIKDRSTLYYLILKTRAITNTCYKINSYPIISVKDFCTNNNLLYRVVEQEQVREICEPEFFGKTEKEIIRTAVSPEIYVAELLETKIIGGNSFLIADDYCLYDMAARDEEKRYDLRYESLKIVKQNNYVIIGSFNSGQVIEEGIFLIGFASNNYYHFTVEICSRLKHVDLIKEYRKIPILIDETALKMPQFNEFLQTINKYNHPIIPIKNQHGYLVKRLIYPSDIAWMPINIKDDEHLKYYDFMVAKSGIEYIRNMVLNATNLKGNRKIFVSRKNYNNQRLVNEKEVAELFIQYGFEVIYPEELSFMEQVEIFSSAKYVAGASGAAFTNIIYCPYEIIFICIIPKEYNFYMYSTIAKIISIHSVFLDARVIKYGRKFSDDQFKLDLNYCKEFLKTL